jgi:hypothetical protein
MTSLTYAGGCGLSPFCLDSRLCRCAFAVGTVISRLCASQSRPSLWLKYQLSFPSPCAFPLCYSYLYSPEIVPTSALLGFLGNPTLKGLAVGSLLSVSTTTESHLQVVSFRSFVLRRLRLLLSAVSTLGMNGYHLEEGSPRTLSRFGRASQPLSLVGPVTTDQPQVHFR